VREGPPCLLPVPFDCLHVSLPTSLIGL
jgi:hypothetical protein